MQVLQKAAGERGRAVGDEPPVESVVEEEGEEEGAMSYLAVASQHAGWGCVRWGWAQVEHGIHVDGGEF